MDIILRRNGLILRRNGFQVTLNDDFLKEWGGGVSADNSTLRIAYRFISNLCQLRQGVDSLPQWYTLDFNPAARVESWDFFNLIC